MAITISGENNNDRILAQDGVIDSISGFNIAGIITASSFTGDLTGDVTGDLTGNVTGNVNNTSNLLLQVGGTEKLRLNSDRVIIGQSLSNNQPSYNTSTTFVTTHTNNVGAWNAIAIISGSSTGASFVKFGDKDNEAVSQIGHYNADNSLRFLTDGTNERLRIDSNGRVLIGHTVASGDLHGPQTTTNRAPFIQIHGANTTSAGAALISWKNSAGAYYAPTLYLAHSGSDTKGTNAIIPANGEFGSIVFSGDDGTDFVKGAMIKARLDGSPGNDNMPGRLEFYTNSGANDTTERLRITSDGKVGINQTSPTCQLQIDSGSSGAGTVTHLELNHKGNDTNDAVKLNFARAGGDIGSIVLEKVASNNTTDFIFNTRSYNTVSESMRITGAGKVGIGTDNPQKLLELQHIANRKLQFSYDDNIITMKGANNNGNPETIRLIGGNSIRFHTGATGSGDEALRIESGGKIKLGSGGAVVGSANVEIRYDNPVLLIRDTAESSADNDAKIGFGNNSHYPVAYMSHVWDGTNGALTFHTRLSGNESEKLRIESGGGLKFTGQGTSIPVGGILHHTNNNLYVRGGTNGLILGNNNNTTTVQIYNGYIKFETNDGTEKLRITSGGHLLVGNTSTAFTTSDVPVVFGSGSGTNGITIYAGSTSTSFIHFADGTSGAQRYAGGIGYNHNDTVMNLSVNDTTRVRINDSNFKEIIFPQQNSSTYASRVYFTEVSTNANSYVKFATITGPSFRTHIKMSCTSTISNVVTNAEFDIQVGHYQDIFVTSRSLDYTQMAIQIKSDGNQNYDLYMRRSGGANTSSFSTHKVAIHPQLFEQVSFNSNTNYNTTTHEHGTIAGTMRLTATGGPDANFRCQGSITKGSGSFTIPHPHPSKKSTHNLNHSFIEGPQCDNIYRGKVTLSSGGATVNLDTVSNMTEGTFVLLNRDVQCFTTNETGWGAIKGSVSGNVLTIAAQDSSSTDTISWMVVGERQDDTIKSSILTDSDGNLKVESLIEEDYDTSNLHQYYPT